MNLKSGSLGFRDDLVWIAGHESLVDAIDQKIEVFQDNRAYEDGLAIGFHDGVENAVATAISQVNALRDRSLCCTTVGAAHFGSPGDIETKLSCDCFGDH